MPKHAELFVLVPIDCSRRFCAPRVRGPGGTLRHLRKAQLPVGPQDYRSRTRSLRTSFRPGLSPCLLGPRWQGVSSGRRPVKLPKHRPLLSYFGARPVDPQRSAIMSRIRGRDTSPEIRLRKAIWRIGARFVTHSSRLPGRPDISNMTARVAVFVDGCFWHGCPRHYRTPRTRRTFWTEKIRRNKERRETVLAQYPAEWHVLQYFECQIEKRLDKVSRQVAAALLKRRGIPARTWNAHAS